MKKDELHARVLYLYQILRHYSDSEHPLTTQQILKIMDEKYHIQIHRVSVQNYVEILNSCGIKVKELRINTITWKIVHLIFQSLS